MPYCTECGTPVNVNNKFCPSCGTKLEPIPLKGAVLSDTQVPTNPQISTESTPPLPPKILDNVTYVEQVKTIIPNLMVYKGLGRYDIYNLIVTNRRSIFSKLTNEMMNKTIKARRAKAESEGKGFFGKWKAQMQGYNTYVDYYQDMAPDQILRDGKDNYALDNSSIRGLNIRDETGDEDMTTWYALEILTTGKSLKFKTQFDPTEVFDTAYGLQKK